MRYRQIIIQAWSVGAWWIAFLWPLSWIYRGVVWLRSVAYRWGMLKVHVISVPVVVVGNITVGGSGKTPLVAWLVRQLCISGESPGVISRGYGGHAGKTPCLVTIDSDPLVVGDEPLLLATQTGCPVVVGADRVAAAHYLLKHAPQCSVIISDDGLQHLALGRDIEIALVDAHTRFGNGHCLPAGPLREPVTRLQQVDFIVTNYRQAPLGADEYAMHYVFSELRNVADPSLSLSLTKIKQRVYVVAGIAQPQSFFAYLSAQGIDISAQAFPDHYCFVPQDFAMLGAEDWVIMTEKDAVKCRDFADARYWYLPIVAAPNARFIDDFFWSLRKI